MLLWNPPKHTNAPDKGIHTWIVALPPVSDTYAAQGKTKQLSDTKLSHVKQMYSNYVQREEWHELIQD